MKIVDASHVRAPCWWERILTAWASEATARVGRLLVVAACALLFLSAAGTLEIVYTIRPSYALLALACGIAAPHVRQGWKRMPATLRAIALGLGLAYVAATLLGDQLTLPGQARGGSHREIAYLADLALGLAVIGLIAGLWLQGTVPRPVIFALVLGAVLAALYGLYQWIAQRYGWPFDDVNNTLDSNLVTNDNDQGPALFGWERIRGTFVEPHLLGSYLAANVPLFAAVIARTAGIIRAAATAGLVAVVLAMVLTASLPAWIIGSIGVLVALAIGASAHRMITASAVLGSLVALAIVMTAIGLTLPDKLAGATGRSPAELQSTAAFRQNAWDGAVDVWSRRPLLGYGPGQSSVQLAYEFQARTGVPEESPPVLVSAQGIWAASLMDAGMAGFVLWALLLGGALALGTRGVWRTPSIERVAVLAAALVAVGASAVATDRLDIRVWVLVGLLLAVAGEREVAQPTAPTPTTKEALRSPPPDHRRDRRPELLA